MYCISFYLRRRFPLYHMHPVQTYLENILLSASSYIDRGCLYSLFKSPRGLLICNWGKSTGFDRSGAASSSSSSSSAVGLAPSEEYGVHEAILFFVFEWLLFLWYCPGTYVRSVINVRLILGKYTLGRSLFTFQDTSRGVIGGQARFLRWMSSMSTLLRATTSDIEYPAMFLGYVWRIWICGVVVKAK